MKEASYTDCEAVVSSLRQSFRAGKSRPYTKRIQNLLAIKKFLLENENEIVSALAKDLGRDHFDAVGLELIPLHGDLDLIVRSLKEWMQPTYSKVPLYMQPATSETVPEPYGVTLIVGSFNYPIQLLVCRNYSLTFYL